MTYLQELEEKNLWQAYVEIVARIDGAIKALGLAEQFDNEIHFLYHMYRKLGKP